MKQILLTAVFFVAFTGFSFGQTDMNELPQNARDFINEHFSAETVEEVDVKDGIEGLFNDEMYEVEFANGIEVEFDENGEMTEMESDNGIPLPMSALPERIRTYIEATYPDAQVKEYEKDDDEQEVELMDGTELEFDEFGEFTELD